MNSQLKSYLQTFGLFFTNILKLSQEKQAMVGVSEPHFNKIATQLRPMVQFLRFVGAYPISESDTNSNVSIPSNQSNNQSNPGIKGIPSFETKDGSKVFLETTNHKKIENNGTEIKSFYKIFSWKLDYTNILYSFIVSFISTLSVIMMLFNIVLNIPFPIKMISVHPSYEAFISSHGNNYNYFSMACLGSCRILEMLTLLLNSGTFVQWLNAWSHFEQEFHNCFVQTNHSFNFDICIFRNMLLIFYACVPNILWVIGGVITAVGFSMFEFHVPYLAMFLLLWSSFQMWSYALVEDFKVFIMLKTITLSSQQIRMRIQDVCKSDLILTPRSVISWRSLIYLIRQQTDLAGSYLKFQQIICLAQAVIVCTLVILFVLDSLVVDLPLIQIFTALLGSVFTCASWYGRVFLKVLCAEQISSEELRLAACILKIDDKCEDLATKYELKFLHDMLTQKPIVVNLGNYFALNKKLLLQVGMQVVTYLIVIMQYSGNKAT